MKNRAGQLLRDVVVVEAVRTAVGRGHPEKGAFRDIHPADLLGRCYVALLERAALSPDAVENAVVGCVYQIAQQAGGIARSAWLQKGLPEETAAMTVDIRCGSGQQAVNIGAMQIATGVHDVVVAGGVEHMGRVGFEVNEAAQRQWGRAQTPELLERYDLVPQGVSAELIADQWSISRAEMDELARESHRRAHAATRNGFFEREIAGIDAGGSIVATDQGIRPDTSLDRLAALEPAFVPGGRVTAGNSSQISDGAAALLLMDREAAERAGLRPRARIVDHVTVGVNPVTMLTGPIPATARILERNGITFDDLAVIEINEAFASVVLAWGREYEPDMSRVNPRGGAIALGHPLGATGARLLTTLIHELEDVDGELGLVTMCCGGGLGTATLVQRL
jgi:acetyl-CoA acetyltransferase family protein